MKIFSSQFLAITYLETYYQNHLAANTVVKLDRKQDSITHTPAMSNPLFSFYSLKWVLIKADFQFPEILIDSIFISDVMGTMACPDPDDCFTISRQIYPAPSQPHDPNLQQRRSSRCFRGTPRRDVLWARDTRTLDCSNVEILKKHFTSTNFILSFQTLVFLQKF